MADRLEHSNAFLLSKPLGYSKLDLGLNNQKIALLGLFSKAFEERLPVVLPQLSNFNPGGEHHITVPFHEFYSVEMVAAFAKAYDIIILNQNPADTTNGWDCFVKGAERLGREAIEGCAALDDFSCQFFRHLAPRIARSSLFDKLVNSVYETQRIQAVAQLRIEKDWAEQSALIRTNESNAHDDYAPNFLEILQKIHNTLAGEAASIYVVCDEANLPVTKEEIRKTVWDRFNISLVWKSDILGAVELAALSILELSTIDFEIAVRAPIFIGLSRSTFSNLVGFESFCRTSAAPQGQYLYNSQGEELVRRYDCGAHVDVASATNPLYLRAPLMADAADDCLWPATLTTHFSVHGDFTTSNSRFIGVRRSPLVCGPCGFEGRYIEGFSLTFGASWNFDIEYRARLPDGRWTEWGRNGEFVGSRGLREVLHGFAARLTGRLALSFECICVGRFAGTADPIRSPGHQGCFKDDGQPLEAMQIVFRPLSYQTL